MRYKSDQVSGANLHTKKRVSSSIGETLFPSKFNFLFTHPPYCSGFVHKTIPILFICTLVFVRSPGIRFSDEVPFIYPIEANAGYFSFIVA